MLHCLEFHKHPKLNRTSRCHFTKKCELCSVFLYLLSSLNEMERKGELLKDGAEEFKPGFAMPALISSPCEVTWKNKGCILPVCRAHQEAKAKVFFLVEKVCCLRRGEMGRCLPELPLFPCGHYSSTDEKKTYFILCLYRAGSSPRSRLSLQDRWSWLFVHLTTLPCVKWPHMPAVNMCVDFCLWDLPRTGEIPSSYCMMAK